MQVIKHAALLGPLLLQWRGEAGLTQEQAARKAGLDASYFSKWERSIRVPDIDSAIAALGVYGRRLAVVTQDETEVLRTARRWGAGELSGVDLLEALRQANRT